jgi:GrpB-like predicted nucleotidyltransferase (UPF0157 family)
MEERMSDAANSNSVSSDRVGKDENASEPRQRYKIEVLDWRPEWGEIFKALGTELRLALGPAALRIDHIGSTAIPGMAAKPIIDVQISVVDLSTFSDFADPLARLGYRFRKDNPELTKRYFREPLGTRRTHIHVRERGGWHEQWALLFRDYMRSNAGEHRAYAELKRHLAAVYPRDMEAYTTGKVELLWQIIQRADHWAKDTGWKVGHSDS